MTCWQVRVSGFPQSIGFRVDARTMPIGKAVAEGNLIDDVVNLGRDRPSENVEECNPVIDAVTRAVGLTCQSDACTFKCPIRIVKLIVKPVAEIEKPRPDDGIVGERARRSAAWPSVPTSLLASKEHLQGGKPVVFVRNSLRKHDRMPNRGSRLAES